MYVPRINVTIWRNSEYRTLSRTKCIFDAHASCPSRRGPAAKEMPQETYDLSFFIIPPAMSLPSCSFLDRPSRGRLRIFLTPFCKPSPAFSRASFPRCPSRKWINIIFLSELFTVYYTRIYTMRETILEITCTKFTLV